MARLEILTEGAVKMQVLERELSGRNKRNKEKKRKKN